MTQGPQQGSTSRKKVFLTITAGALLGVVAVYVAAVFFAARQTPNNTNVAGVNVGGMSIKEATAKLEQQLGDESRQPITVEVNDKTYEIDPVSAGLSIDYPKTLAHLAQKPWNPIELWSSLFGTVNVKPVVLAEQEKLDAALAAITDKADTPPVEPTITFSGQTPKLTNGKVGNVLSVADSEKLIIGTFPVAKKPLVLPFGPENPTVSDEVANSFLTKAKAEVSSPITVTVGKQKGVISTQALAQALSYQGKDGKMVAVIDGTVLVNTLKSQISGITDTAVNASFKIVNGKPVVVPSKPGRGINSEKIASALQQVIDSPNPRTVELEMGDTQPEFTTEDAKALGITEKLSSFTQHFPYAPYRVQNIGRAARYLDGTIVKPGEIFSMNDTVHERTEANGYTVGYIIGNGGQFRKELGGGVSTATTAVWTAAFYANMQRVEQRAHTIWIPRYRAGLEATVSWGYLDMKWKNTSSNGVLIKASITNNSVTVTLYGTKNFDRVDAVSGPWRNIKAFNTIHSTIQGCEYQGGMAGFDITVTRVVTIDGEVVKREPFYTHYAPEPKVICGKAPKPSSTPTAKPLPSHS